MSYAAVRRDDDLNTPASDIPDTELDDETKQWGLEEDEDDIELRSIHEEKGQDAADPLSGITDKPDDPTLPTLTLRVFIIGLILCCLGSSVSQLFYFKSNAPSFSSFFVILISLPMGNFLATHLPERNLRLLGREMPLNPGPFSVKEHLLVTILATSGAEAAYAGDIIAVQDLYYHQDIGPIGGMLLLLTTQLIGFGLAGLCYDILVRPKIMVWPSTIAIVSLFDTLHGDSGLLTRQRLRFFTAAFLGCFAWQFMPALFAPGLTSFATLCVINNSSSIMRVLGSTYEGFGQFSLSLDWSVIGSTGGLYTPFWASLNFFIGLGAMMYIIGPMLYFSDFWSSLSFPQAISAHLYNTDYGTFNVSAVVTPDLRLDRAAFDEMKPILLTPYFALTYGISFAVLTSTITTVLLWHRDTIGGAFGGRSSEPDRHVIDLERNYELVPKSWYLGLFISMTALSIYTMIAYPLQLPVWGLLLSILVAVVFLIPGGVIAGITDTRIGLNVITEFIAGFLLPGLPIANITFKCYGYMAMTQALSLVADLKIGAYMKIPPKDLFICQALGTAVGSIVNFSLIKGVIASKRPYLDGTLQDPTSQWTGRAPSIFYSASVIWGLIGPLEFFAGQYQILYWGFALGAIAPIIPWLVWKKYPAFGRRFHLDKWSFPIIFHASIGPPQTPSNIVLVGFLSAVLSQFYALRYHTKWFTKYNYVMSAAFDAATSINALVIYFTGVSALVGNWWFNSALDTEHCRPGS